MVDTLVALHAVDIRAAGLDAIGKPEGFLERQVTGWVGRWRNAVLPESPDASRVIALLTSALPPSPAPTVVHNDYKLDNVMFSSSEPAVITAVLDLSRADRSYVLDSLKNPPFLSGYWQQMMKEVKQRADEKPA